MLKRAIKLHPYYKKDEYKILYRFQGYEILAILSDLRPVVLTQKTHLLQEDILPHLV